MKDENGRILECPHCRSQRITPIGKERNCFIYICNSCRFTSPKLGFRAIPLMLFNPSKRDSYIEESLRILDTNNSTHECSICIHRNYCKRDKITLLRSTPENVHSLNSDKIFVPKNCPIWIKECCDLQTKKSVT